MINNKGNRNPMYGKHHSKEAKVKMRYKALLRCKDSKYIKFLGSLRKGKNPWNKNKTNIYSKETLIKMSKTRIGRKASKETIEKLKKTHAGLHQGRNNPMFGKSVHVKKVKYKNIWMRSTWEVNFAKWLDLSKIKWKYESKTFDLGNYTYTPDFYLPEFDYYIEIKGWFHKIAKYKVQKFNRLYKTYNLLLLKQAKLKNMSII